MPNILILMIILRLLVVMICLKTFRYLPLLLLILLNAACASVPSSHAIPGGISVISLPDQTATHHWKTFYNQQRCPIVTLHNHPYAVVGIPLSTKAGTYYLTAENNDPSQSIRIPFHVYPAQYPAQYITMKVSKRPSKVKFDGERYERERQMIEGFYQHWSDNDDLRLNFKLPVKGRISGPFGFQRFFNGVKASEHSGVDIAAKKGTRIRAPAPAVVLNTGRYYFCGNSIFLDHGQQVISVYCHLNKILVKEGQSVKQGQTIGLVGQSGRATGPHLHWGVSLNNTHINPLYLI